jgi:RND family efflux transporter MFP subunit
MKVHPFRVLFYCYSRLIPHKPDIRIWLPLLVLLAATGGASAIVALKPKAAASMPESLAPSVEIIRAEPQTLRMNVISQGVVTPREEIDLVAEVSGKVVQVHPSLAAGGFFSANDLLLTVDPRPYDYAIVTAQAKVAEAERTLIAEQAQVEQAESEWRALGEGQASDLTLHKPQLAEAKAKLQAARADLAKARLDRSLCELRAPFDGRVLNRRAGLGQYLQAGAAVARIFASDIAEIRLPIGIDQLAFLDLPLGDSSSAFRHAPAVTLSAEVAGKRQRWQGRIVRSEAALDETSGQLYLIAEVEQPFRSSPGRPPLMSGLFVQAEIEGVPQESVYALPRTALNSLQQAKLVNAEQRLEMRPLEILRTESDRVIVKSGLQPGDRVIVSELPVPVAGMRVNIAEAAAILSR